MPYGVILPCGDKSPSQFGTQPTISFAECPDITAHPCNTNPKPITPKGNRLEVAHRTSRSCTTTHHTESLFFALTALSKSSQYALYSIAVPTQTSQTSRVDSGHSMENKPVKEPANATTIPCLRAHTHTRTHTVSAVVLRATR